MPGGRKRRQMVITLLREDGMGFPYKPPRMRDDCFSVPHEYWTSGWHRELSLPAKAMLLIALPFHLASAWPASAPSRYGLSSDTAERCLRELRQRKIVGAEPKCVREARSDTGWTTRWYYTLTGDFSTNHEAPSSQEDGEPSWALEGSI